MASGHPIDKFAFLYPPESSQNLKSKGRVSSSMNPVYSPVQPGTAYANPKNMAYPGYPAGYPTTAPAYTPNIYQTGTPGYPPGEAHSLTALSVQTQSAATLISCATSIIIPFALFPFIFIGYTTGAPYKVPPTQSNGAPPPYSASPNPYSTAMYPIRSAYPQQNLYAQGAYYSQPMFAQPHVIHHTTVVQPNSLPSAIYPAPVSAARPNSVAMGMLAGSTMAMSAGPLLTTPQHTQHIGAHPVTVPTYRQQGTPGYSYVPPHW
ncbi:protein FAM168A isoform X1 [Astyanax mexicanus]|uniref:Protein FAM168A isoform X1 n=1 Tax=Astyanax mexicanus TaxID=7994 RepID=A0A8T2KWN9_ASTMX|nr:protein FAM168A isoform X1 [Astyanax mexicanus]